MMRGIAVPTTVWSSELRNIESITPAIVRTTCLRGRERRPVAGALVLLSMIMVSLFQLVLTLRVDHFVKEYPILVIDYLG